MGDKILLIWLNFLFLFLLVACQVKSTLPEAEPVTIRFAILTYQQQQYEELKQQFEEINPNINVQLVYRDEILKQDPNSMSITVSGADDLLLAKSADVFSPIFLPNAVERGVLLDLTPFMDADDTFSDDDFYPGLLEQSQWNGRTWALPYEAVFTFIYFNKDVFDQANVEYPQPGWTWEDFTTAAKSLTVVENGNTTQWGFIDSQFNPLLFVHSYAGPLFEPHADPPLAHLNKPTTVTAVQWYTDLYLRHEVATHLPQAEADVLISRGQVAMWTEFVSRGEQRRSLMNLGVAPFPVHTASDYSTPISLVRNYAISAGTTHPDEAWQWLKFIDQQPKSWSQLEGPTTLPAQRFVTETSSFWQDMDKELETAWRYAIDHAFLPVYGEGFSSAIEMILNGDASVADALSLAQDAAEEANNANLAEKPEISVTPIVMDDLETVTDETTSAIEFGVSLNQLQTYRILANQFQSTHPKITVNVTALDLNNNPSLSAFANVADCFQWLPYFEEGGEEVVLNMNPFFDADPTISKNDFFLVALDQFTYQGQLRGLPSEITVSTIVFNKDLFDTARIRYPEPDWTTNDFLETAVTLTQGSGETKQYGFIPDLYEPNDLLDFTVQLAGDTLINEKTSPPTLHFTDPAFIQGMHWYVNLTKEYNVKPILLIDADNDGFEEFQERSRLINNNQAAMWSDSGSFAGGASFMSIGSSESELANLGILPLPVAPDGSRRGGYRATSGYFISAKTEVPQECWQWITFLTERPDLSIGLPARQETAKSLAYQQHIGIERAEAYLFTIQNAAHPSFFDVFTEDPWLDYFSIWLAEAYRQIVSEDLSIESALEEAQATAESFRTCILEEDTSRNQGKLQRCMGDSE